MSNFFLQQEGLHRTRRVRKMYSAWFNDKVLQQELKRIELAGEDDDMFEQFEGLGVVEEEDNPNEQAYKSVPWKSGGDYLNSRERVWKRLLPNSKLTNSDDFIFQHVDTTQGVHHGVPGIHLWGCTSEGQSVAVITKSFRPYFYARISNEPDVNHVRERMEYLLNPYYRPGSSEQKVVSVEFVRKLSMCGWAEDRPPETMVKITMADCSGINKARKALDYGNRFVVPHDVPVQTFEANVQFELRYMVDHKMGGCQWIKLKANKFIPVPKEDRLSSADYEFYIDKSEAIECIPVKEKGDIAPLRILSFDIECKKSNGNAAGFVKPEVDPIICVCVELQVYGKGTIHRAAFCYVEKRHQKVEPIPYDASKGELPVELFVYDYETDMILGLVQYFTESDPDALTGWNIGKFDLPYLFKRAAALGISGEFVKFTRMMESKARIREVVVQSKAFGMKKMCETTCEGRFIYDALDFMTFGQLQKFRDYRLNSMAKELLGDEKVDVHYTQIGPLHEGSDKDRSRLIYYCCVDAQLPLKILQARMGLVNGIEQARVTGVPIKWILGGQGRKTFSNILRFKRDYEVVPTRSPKMNTTFTAGGYVRKPIVGYYTTPIGTLDFNSLYPSIMQAYNICYSTVTSAQRAKELIRMGKYKREDFEWPPGFENDFCFVGPHIRLGILPDLLTQLLEQRAYVKGLQKKLDKTKPEEKALWEVLENRQLALKLCCNSVYGFLKAFILVDPRLMSAVTAWGQDMIKETARIVETEFKDNEIVDRKACEKLGLDFEQQPKEGEVDNRPKMKYSPRIIYGDTDSIMVDFGDIGLQDIVRLQRDAAARCNAKMKKPNNLDPESVKLNAIYIAPKMYASLEILTGDIKPTDRLEDARKKAKISCKGLQSKRRDNALIGSENQGACLKTILKEGNIQGAIDIVKKNVSDVLMDRVDLSKFVISKGLSKTDAEYKKGGTKQLHTALKERMTARAKTTGELVPETGDRVPFIMRARYKKEQSSECSEDPLYAQKNRIPIDKTYYIEKQIMAGTLKVFTAIWEPERISEIKSSMSEKKLRTFRAYQELFAPSLPHMLQKKERKIGEVLGIEAFAVALPQCLYVGCGVLLREDSPGVKQILCPSHQDDYEEARLLLEEQKESLERVRDAAWARCRTCAGGYFDEVTCANTTCDNYFHRDRAVMDIEDLEKDMVRFAKSKNLYAKQRSSPPRRGLMDMEEVIVEKEKPKRLKNGNISNFLKRKN